MGENQTPQKPKGILRYALTLEDVKKDYYLIPKDRARELLKEAMLEIFDEHEIDVKESVRVSLMVLDNINDLLER